MTILAGVLALAPLLCWELADGSGPAASDASGNAHPGVYSGAFSLLQPGPEAGTFGVLLSQSAVVSGAAGTIAAPPYSFHAWIALRSQNSINHSLLGQDSAGVGESLLWEAGGVGATQIGYVQQNIRVGGSARYITDGLWHQLVWTRDGANNCALYIDGGLVYSASLSMNAPSGASTFHAGGTLGSAGDQVFFYCAALYSFVLTGPQIATLYGSVSGAIQTPANLNTISAADVTSINAQLAGLTTAPQQLVKSTTSPTALTNPYSGSGSLSANAGGVFALGVHWSVNTAPLEAGQTPRSILIYSQAFLSFSVSYTLHDASSVVGETVLSGEAEGLHMFDGPQPASVAYQILPGWTVHLDWLVKA